MVSVTVPFRAWYDAVDMACLEHCAASAMMNFDDGGGELIVGA